LVGTIATNESKTTIAMNAKVAGDQAKLSEKWGAAEAQNKEIVTNFAKKFGAPAELQAGIAAGKVGSEAMIWLHGLATKSLSSAGNFQEDDGGGSGIMTPADAMSAKSEIMNNPKHAYWQKMDPNHDAAVARVRELILLAQPSLKGQAAPGSQF